MRNPMFHSTLQQTQPRWMLRMCQTKCFSLAPAPSRDTSEPVSSLESQILNSGRAKGAPAFPGDTNRLCHKDSCPAGVPPLLPPASQAVWKSISCNSLIALVLSLLKFWHFDECLPGG